MGIFSRMKRTVTAKANAAIDKAIDPEKELELAISELEDARQKALSELVSYKATAKQMEQDLAKEERRAAEWEKRAMAAIKSGDDELAKQALREKQKSQAEIARLKSDRDEAASYAIKLNKSRKEAEAKLRMLKLRKGTLATQIKMGRSGGGPALGGDGEVWNKFDETEARIDQDAIEAEVMAAMSEDGQMDGSISEAEFDRKLIAAGAEPGAGGRSDESADDPLAALKAKMAAQESQKKLSE